MLRRRILFILILLILPVLFTVAGCDSSLSRSGLNPGDPPPNITLPSLTGPQTSLSDFKGKVVLLNFWATWCSPCVLEMPALEQLYQKFKDKGFVVVGVAVSDDAAKVKELVNKLHLSFPILLDPQGNVKKSYKLTGFPESFILDKEGKLVMLPDPATNQPLVRIVGPRDWQTDRSSDWIRQLIEEPYNS